MDYLSTLKGIYLNPIHTARSLKKEKFPKPFVFFLITIIISSIVYFVSSSIAGYDLQTSLTDALKYILSIALVSALIVLIAQFIFKLFGDRGDYIQRFKAIAYASALEIAFAVLSIGIFMQPSLYFVEYLLGLWILFLYVSFLREYSTLPKAKFIMAMVILVTIQIAIYFVSDYFFETGFII